MTAHSQFMGGTIGGLSSALLEETESDAQLARSASRKSATSELSD
jgi:CO/xanthine dehydrogenase Mo-binding subunit